MRTAAKHPVVCLLLLAVAIVTMAAGAARPLCALNLVGARTQLVTTGALGDATTTYQYNAGHALTQSTTGGTDTVYSYMMPTAT